MFVFGSVSLSITIIIIWATTLVLRVFFVLPLLARSKTFFTLLSLLLWLSPITIVSTRVSLGSSWWFIDVQIDIIDPDFTSLVLVLPATAITLFSNPAVRLILIVVEGVVLRDAHRRSVHDVDLELGQSARWLPTGWVKPVTISALFQYILNRCSQNATRSLTMSVSTSTLSVCLLPVLIWRSLYLLVAFKITWELSKCEFVVLRVLLACWQENSDALVLIIAITALSKWQRSILCVFISDCLEAIVFVKFGTDNRLEVSYFQVAMILSGAILHFKLIQI